MISTMSGVKYRFVKALLYPRFRRDSVAINSFADMIAYCEENSVKQVVMILRNLETGQELTLTFDNASASNFPCNVTIEERTT